MKSGVTRSVLIRCDASVAGGMGHLSRCMTLAEALRESGAHVSFLLRAGEIDLNGIFAGGYHYSTIDWDTDSEQDAALTVEAVRQESSDLLIVDHYRADERYQTHLRNSDIRWLQFTGAQRIKLLADYVLDAGPGVTADRYRGLVCKSSAQLLMGPAYALIRPEFKKYREGYTVREPVKRIGITFGGGDDSGASLLTLEALKQLDTEAQIKLISGAANKQLPSVRNWVARYMSDRVELIVDCKNMALTLSQCDLAITAGGTTTNEIAALGVPSVIICIADNQERIAAGWSALNVAENAGRLEELVPEMLAERINHIMMSPDIRRFFSANGRKNVDCEGARRVAGILLNDGEARS